VGNKLVSKLAHVSPVKLFPMCWLQDITGGDSREGESTVWFPEPSWVYMVGSREKKKNVDLKIKQTQSRSHWGGINMESQDAFYRSTLPWINTSEWGIFPTPSSLCRCYISTRNKELLTPFFFVSLIRTSFC